MRHRLAEHLKIPADLSDGDILVSLTGSEEAFVENYRGILEYTDTRILLQGKGCQVLLEGKRIQVTYYTNEEMQIQGVFDHIRFLN